MRPSLISVVGGAVGLTGKCPGRFTELFPFSACLKEIQNFFTNHSYLVEISC